MQVDPGEIVARVLRFAQARGLFRPGPVVVAVSGGQDSVCMLDVLRCLRDDLGIDLRVAHLNHMFRGAQSESEAEYVRTLAEGWGLPAYVAAIDVPSYRARHRLSKQVAARHARFWFLAAVAERVGSSQVAVGHTADDAIETLLINLMRGTGLAGLRGMAPTREMEPGQLGPALRESDWCTDPLPPPRSPLPTLVRPLLELFRTETAEYCRSRGLAFRQDPSNLDMAYRRNWIRGQLLPIMEQHAPGVRERLLNTADLLADEYAVVMGAVDRAWSELARVSPGRVEFGLEEWGRLDAAIQRQLLRLAVETLAGSLENLGRIHVDACATLIRRGAVGGSVDLPGGLRLEKGYASFRIERREGPGSRAWGEALAAPEEPVPLPVPGVVELPGGRIEAGIEELPVPEEVPAACRRADQLEACLDADRVGATLTVRRRRPGDRFVPLGMERPKKLHDFMVDAKIPRSDRDRVPLVATPDDIVWVVGYRIDDRFKVTPNTRRLLKLRCERGPGIED